MQFAPLRHVAEIRSGVGFPNHLQGRTEGKYPFAKVGDISKLARSGASNLHGASNYIDDTDLAQLKAKPFPAGTVVFAKIGEAIRQNFRAILNAPALVDNNVMGVIPRPEALDPRYLYHHLMSIDMYPLAQSTTVPSIRKTDLERLQIPLPPLAQQKRIVAILDYLDELRSKRRQAITLLDDLILSIFRDTFGEGGWPTEPLSRVVREGTIVTYGIVQAGNEYPGGVPYIRTGDIKGGEIITGGLRRTSPLIAEKYARSRVRPGEIVMSIRATVGTTALVPEELDGANLTQGTARISPGDRVSAEYLLAYLRSHEAQSWIQRQVKGATFREITLAKLRELVVPLPPIEQQQVFAEQVKHLRGLAKTHRTHLSTLDELFASLQQRAFSGTLWDHGTAG
ncbi:restriction endonuclease subunit S [Streptomyces sp. NPDC046859]|uniref:restriction endonuclease subunit S n=1 Tax=Streptomyces sp. NPDC046859 TaxID=3155734 RepID=UPI0033E75B54